MANRGPLEPTRSDHLSDRDLAGMGLSRETSIRLDATGCWFVGGSPVAHERLQRAWAAWIERTDDDRYVLRNDLHYVYIEVEGAPLHARHAHHRPSGWTLELTDGTETPLHPDTLRAGPDGTLYASGRDGSWPIRLAPAAVLDLADALAEDGDDVALKVDGRRYPIRSTSDPLARRGVK